MRVLMFGSRSLTWKHLPIFRSLARHAFLRHSGLAPLDLWLTSHLNNAPLTETSRAMWLREEETLTLIHGDGPPSPATKSAPCPIGADRLAELACMEAWPAEQRRVRRFPVDPTASEEWGQAAKRRNYAMVMLKPERSYCVHTDLDSSKGSKITQQALKESGLPFWYVRVTSAGALVSVETR